MKEKKILVLNVYPDNDPASPDINGVSFLLGLSNGAGQKQRSRFRIGAAVKLSLESKKELSDWHLFAFLGINDINEEIYEVYR